MIIFVRNVLLISSAVIVLFAVIGGILMTNAEIKELATYAFKFAMIAAVIQTVLYLKDVINENRIKQSTN